MAKIVSHAQIKITFTMASVIFVVIAGLGASIVLEVVA
jgi:hypothetical protein